MSRWSAHIAASESGLYVSLPPCLGIVGSFSVVGGFDRGFGDRMRLLTPKVAANPGGQPLIRGRQMSEPSGSAVTGRG